VKGTTDREALLARRLAGEDGAAGKPSRVSYEPIEPAGHPDGEVKIGKSLRVPLGMYEQISAMATSRRMSWSALVREWIAEGLVRGEADEVDPVVELHRHLDAAGRALRALEDQRDVA
jgi:hypothetical protein